MNHREVDRSTLNLHELLVVGDYGEITVAQTQPITG